MCVCASVCVDRDRGQKRKRSRSSSEGRSAKQARTGARACESVHFNSIVPLTGRCTPGESQEGQTKPTADGASPGMNAGSCAVRLSNSACLSAASKAATTPKAGAGAGAGAGGARLSSNSNPATASPPRTLPTHLPTVGSCSNLGLAAMERPVSVEEPTGTALDLVSRAGLISLMLTLPLLWYLRL